jgi:hypothetical protein
VHEQLNAEKEPSVRHVPLFLHGLEWHGSFAIKNKKKFISTLRKKA